MKKLLFQFDTDPIPAAFDSVVAYDGGADHVTAYGGIHPSNVGPLVEGCIFTRAPKEKQLTAIFVGGSNMAAGQELFEAVKKKFFANFRVSVMLDSNGSNTTAAAAVAYLTKTGSVKGKRAIVLAGTGPVGQRAAALLAQEGAQVALTSRQLERAESACELIHRRFGVSVTALKASDNDARAAALDGARLVLAAGAAGAQLLTHSSWRDNPTIEIMADANAQPPLGIEGVDLMDKGDITDGKVVYGAIGFGALKLKLHRACIGKLFEAPDRVLDAEEIYALAKTMV